MRVTLADRSPAMLAKAQARALRAGVEIEWLQTDLWDYQPEVRFDHVCANHFFNVYGEADMQRMRARLMGWLVPGGSLHIADFRPLFGGRLARMAQRVHHAIPLAGCSAFTRNALHPIYDHDRWGEQQPGRLQVQDHRMWWIGPGWYRTWRLETESRTPAQPT